MMLPERSAATPPLRRARVLFRLKSLLEQHMGELAEVVTEELSVESSV